MPFITAGDPDMQTTIALIKRLAKEGVDLIELGIPYSDPVADGPVIQASYTRALGKKITLKQIFDAVRELDKTGLPPIIPMVSYAIIFRHGIDTFLKDAHSAGFAGFIIPDLPGDEARELFNKVGALGMDLIQLVAPASTPERVSKVLSACSGFVYVLGVSGITGERQSVADELLTRLDWLKTQTSLPLAVGFGVSQPEHVSTLRNRADGAIVGSAIVRRCELAEGAAPESAVESVGQYASTMVAACRA